MNKKSESERKRREILRKASIYSLFIPVLLIVFGYYTFDQFVIFSWWTLGNVLFIYALILLHFFAVNPAITFWRLNAYFAIGLTVWAIPMTFVVREINAMISYIVGGVLIMMGISIAGFSFWAEKESIEVS
ncbi:MAG: hypothetical protein ACOC40_03075 [Thermoplasmatota archaeon]